MMCKPAMAFESARCALILLCPAMFAGSLMAMAEPAHATACMFEPQGEGRVSAVIDERTLRLEDGREVRLSAIEPAVDKTEATDALAEIVAGRDVTLRGESDSPDRYGRQPAFVFVDQSDSPVQALLLKRGKAWLLPSVIAKNCASELGEAEAAARQAGLGAWGDNGAIRHADRPGDIVNRIGQFTVIEGKVLSVREAGATTYINFGRRWTRDFAVTISKRAMAAFAAAGIAVKSFENRRIRVRGWVEAHGGPRIEAIWTGQIELLGND